MSDFNLKDFPTTRYQGSKRKILSWIHENIKDLEFHSVLDAFGGTGSVSFLFKKMGKEVTYNDKLKFNYTIGKALIQNQSVTFLEEDYADLNKWVKENIFSDFIQQTFKGIYYLNKENKWLDGINNGIINMNHYTGEVLDYKKSVAYYALFQACMIKRPYNLFHRNNLSMRTKDVERNFGNKITWEKSFQDHFQNFVKEANSKIFDSGVRCTALNRSVLDLDTNYDLVYLDPPYVAKKEKNETADYLKCYHFLEGLVNYEQWPELIDYDSRNLRFKNLDNDLNSQKEDASKNFEEIISKFRNSTIVFSYKKGGTPSIETLVRIMKKYKRTVRTRSMEYVYALNRQNNNPKLNREVLIIGI